MKAITQSSIITLFAASVALSAFAQTAPVMKMTKDIPPEITTPDTVETSLGTLHFSDGLPDNATVNKAYAISTSCAGWMFSLTP
jgi:hypothetical protein